MSSAHCIVDSSAHSQSIPSLHLRHSSFSNPSLTLPTSQLILQPFRCFSYVTAYSPTVLSLFLRHRIFTYVTWRAAHDSYIINFINLLLEFNFPLIGAFTSLTPPGLYRALTCQERELTINHIHTFLPTQGHGGPPRMRDQLNAGATSETTRTLKTIHITHSHIQSNMANTKV